MPELESFDHSYDVVVVGTGAAGLATAMGAADEGLRVLLLESTQSVAATRPCPGEACGCPIIRLCSVTAAATPAAKR